MNFGIILAGGIGNRMKQDIPKQYLIVEGKPVLVYTLESFQNSDRIDHIVIVADEVWRADIIRWMGEYGISKFLAFADPGKSRQESVFSGLSCCKSYSLGEKDVVVVHESARAMVSNELIAAIVDGLEGFDGCIPVIPMKDAIIFSQDGDKIDELIDRSKLFCGQAPESFYLHPYWEINNCSTEEQLAEIRGDHELCFQNHWKLRCIAGEENNFKLTTPGDIDRMISLLRNKSTV